MQSPEASGLRWLFLDLNSYFASVEQQENPALVGRPVAVLPAMTDSTCAIAASYEAKAYGIKTGTPIYEARRLCPHLVCILARHDVYVAYHHRIRAAVEKHLPIHKIWSIDEMDCELIGREKNPDHAIRIARAIKVQLRTDLGPAITCSIGIAPNSFLAKVASDMQKPDGLILLRPEDLPEKLLGLKLNDLPGINTRMELRLWRGKIRTLSDFWNASPKQARQVWGSVQGERFWYWLHGYDPPVPATQTCMVGHSRMLDPALRTAEKARQMARRLLFKATTRLRRKGLCAGILSLSVRLTDGARWAGERRLMPAQDHLTFLAHLDTLWADMALSVFQCAVLQLPQNRMLFKKVSVILHGLRAPDAVTDDLFDVMDATQNPLRQRRENISRAIETLQQKYRQELVTLGVPPKTEAGHVATKIAFSRIPDQEDFWT